MCGAIIAAIELGISNALIEGINAKIRLINARGYGHHSAEALSSMIYPLPERPTPQTPHNNLRGRTCVLMAPTASPPHAGACSVKEIAVTMTVDTPVAEALPNRSDIPESLVAAGDNTPNGNTRAPDAPVPEATAGDKRKKAPVKKTPGKKTKTLELTLTVTGTADGEWHAELKQGATYLARNLTVAAAAVSRAAKELHEDLSTPIDGLIEEARSQQAARVAALEAELEAARKVLADLD